MAIKGAVATYTASAPRAMALTTSAEFLKEPDTTSETEFLILSSLSLWSTAAKASSIGIPTLSLILVGAAPVPPRKPSITIMSAPARATPETIAEQLCTAAIFTATGFLYWVASFKDQISWRKSSIEYISWCGAGDMASEPDGIIRALLTSTVTFSPGRCPPMPGFAPCPILISINRQLFKYCL